MCLESSWDGTRETEERDDEEGRTDLIKIAGSSTRVWVFWVRLSIARVSTGVNTSKCCVGHLEIDSTCIAQPHFRIRSRVQGKEFRTGLYTRLQHTPTTWNQASPNFRFISISASSALLSLSFNSSSSRWAWLTDAFLSIESATSERGRKGRGERAKLTSLRRLLLISPRSSEGLDPERCLLALIRV